MTGAGQREEFSQLTHNRKPAPRIEIDEKGTEGTAQKLSEMKCVCVSVCEHHIWRAAASLLWCFRLIVPGEYCLKISWI